METATEQDPFIGQRFGDGGHLEVIGWDGRKVFTAKKYTVKCGICANDPELFGDGIFYAVKSHLKSGRIPCGCAPTVKWKNHQYEILASRLCADRGIDFLRLVPDNTRHGARVELSCPCCNHKWTSYITNLENSLGCPECIETGYKQRLPACVYVMKVRGQHDFTGFGISNNFETRHRTHRRNLRSVDSVIDDFEVFHTDGKTALEVERSVRKKFPKNPQPIEGFMTEATFDYLYNDLVEFVDEEVRRQETQALDGLDGQET